MHHIIVNKRKDILLKNSFRKLSLTLFRYVFKGKKQFNNENGNPQNDISKSES